MLNHWLIGFLTIYLAGTNYYYCWFSKILYLKLLWYCGICSPLSKIIKSFFSSPEQTSMNQQNANHCSSSTLYNKGLILSNIFSEHMRNRFHETNGYSKFVFTKHCNIWSGISNRKSTFPPLQCIAATFLSSFESHALTC